MSICLPQFKSTDLLYHLDINLCKYYNNDTICYLSIIILSHSSINLFLNKFDVCSDFKRLLTLGVRRCHVSFCDHLCFVYNMLI